MVRKATKILKALKELPDTPPEPIEESVVELEKEPEPAPEPPAPPAPVVEKRKRKEKDPIAEELKRMRKSQEDAQHLLEARLEGLITRKFIEIKNLPAPPTIKEIIREVPVYKEKEDDFSGYLTQEEEKPVEKPRLYNKIFG